MPKLLPGPMVVATHNAGKLEEISALLGPYGMTLVSAGSLGLPEPAETEDSFAGNARIKAHAAAQATGIVALADDSGICVDALGGAPGVHTADWAEGPGGRDFRRAMQHTWDLLQAAAAPEPRRAQFRCTLVLAWPDGRDAVFEGMVAGRIVWPMRGDLGHGYDPIFQPDGHLVTFGEMDRWEKNRISHRADAFAQLVRECFT
ncbi:MAG: RdgB/HAM1 family non-canonical purine NTP pyrophosphatase [Paracoccaceae bacterium]|nr:MAG: RdgB/HAM1 family non-canonical purine NTP pyrophosphatase [Paracoccaceae bacterium]